MGHAIDTLRLDGAPRGAWRSRLASQKSSGEPEAMFRGPLTMFAWVAAIGLGAGLFAEQPWPWWLLALVVPAIGTVVAARTIVGHYGVKRTLAVTAVVVALVGVSLALPPIDLPRWVNPVVFVATMLVARVLRRRRERAAGD